jgi:hypothetical protein
MKPRRSVGVAYADDVPTRATSAPFPIRRADELPEPNDQDEWLIEGMWLGEGVGIIRAIPKSQLGRRFQ